jgi:hypothetical protein
MATMMTRQEMIDYLEANRIRKAPPPAPKPKAASERAQERFDEAAKPTIAMVQDAAAHNKALFQRMREEREAANPIDYQQALIDRCWERTIEAQAAQEEYGRSLCHRGPGDSDWDL